MPLDVGADEGAEGKDGQALGAGPGKRLADERAAQAPALELGLDLGVNQGDRARPAAVGDVAGMAPLDEDLKTTRLRVVAELRWWWRPQPVQQRHREPRFRGLELLTLFT